MGRASALLTPRALGLLTALGAALVGYYVWGHSLPNTSVWWDVGFLGLALIPAVFGLVLIVLPLRLRAGLLPVGAALAFLAFVCDRAHLDISANFAKLAAATALGFWFLRLFETLAWVALVAAIIPWVDAYSVWRGPTRHIVANQPQIFTALSFAFPVPGERGSANLGLPDLLFFAFFLAAAARFRLRIGWTWLALTLSFGTTLALAVWLDLVGLPALPGLAVGFLLPNVDLLWRRLRRRAACETELSE